MENSQPYNSKELIFRELGIYTTVAHRSKEQTKMYQIQNLQGRNKYQITRNRLSAKHIDGHGFTLFMI